MIHKWALITLTSSWTITVAVVQDLKEEYVPQTQDTTFSISVSFNTVPIRRALCSVTHATLWVAIDAVTSTFDSQSHATISCSTCRRVMRLPVPAAPVKNTLSLRTVSFWLLLASFFQDKQDAKYSLQGAAGETCFCTHRWTGTLRAISNNDLA